MAEIETYARELRWILSEAADCLDGLDAAGRTWRPIASGNDAETIVRHMLGATRAYAVGIGGSVPVGRDRPAEFRRADDDERLVDRLRALGDEIDDVLSNVTTEDLDRAAQALAEWHGREPPAGTRRDAIVESIRHAGIHLGELRLTADLATRAAGSS